MADGGGFDPSLLLFGPQYLQIQRQQALAEKLMGAQPVPYEIGGYPTGPGAFLASGLSNVLGAYEGRQADKGLANLYGQSGLLGGPRSFQPMNGVASVDTGYGKVPVPSATANPMNWQQSQQQPDLWVQAKIIGVKYGPEAAQAYIASNGDMDAVKRALSVKSLPPAPKDYGYVPDPNNPSQWTLAGIPVKEEVSGAPGRPPQVSYVAPPTLGTAPTAAPGGNVTPSGTPPPVPRPAGNLGVDYNNPMNIQPKGQEQYFQNPTAGVLAADRLLQSYGARGINTVAQIVRTWAPQAPPQYAAQIAQEMGVQPDQPINLNDVNVRGAYLEAASPHETGRPLPTAGQGGPQQQQPQAPSPQAPHILTEQEKQAYTATQKAQSDAENALPHVRANTQQLLQDIDDLGKTSADIPQSLGGSALEAAYWADKNVPGITPYKGKLATAVERWEQIGNSKALANIAQLAQSGIGRMDIPIVNAIKQASIAPWNLTSQGRTDLLQQLRAMVINNQTVTENTARGFHGQAPLPMQSGFPPPNPQAQPKAPPAPPVAQRQNNTVYMTPKGPLRWISAGATVGWMHP